MFRVTICCWGCSNLKTRYSCRQRFILLGFCGILFLDRIPGAGTILLKTSSIDGAMRSLTALPHLRPLILTSLSMFSFPITQAVAATAAWKRPLLRHPALPVWFRCVFCFIQLILPSWNRWIVVFLNKAITYSFYKVKRKIFQILIQSDSEYSPVVLCGWKKWVYILFARNKKNSSSDFSWISVFKKIVVGQADAEHLLSESP